MASVPAWGAVPPDRLAAKPDPPEVPHVDELAHPVDDWIDAEEERKVWEQHVEEKGQGLYEMKTVEELVGKHSHWAKIYR